MSFWSALVSSDDVRADSVVVGMLLCLMALCIFTGYDVIIEHHEFGAIDFATAAGEIIGAGAGIKTVRDRFSNGKPTGPAPGSPPGRSARGPGGYDTGPSIAGPAGTPQGERKGDH